MARTKVLTLLSLATLFTPVFAASAQMLGMNPAGPGSAIPGTVNYVEGQAALDGHAVLPRNNNNQGRLPVLGEGQTLSTADGRVEILLTPGIFLRVDHNSTVKMISPDLTRTEVALDRGRAELEVDALYKQNDLRIDDGSTQAKILKNGLYEFDANGSAAPDVRVFDGRLAVSESQDAKWVEVGSGHQLALAGSTAKPQHFDKVAAEDDLYSWSSLRADYLGQANASLLNAEYAGAPGLYPGWAWDPYLLGYTWLPGDGFLYSPFGFGFYSPAFFYGGGFGFYRGGYYRAGGGGYGGFHGAESGGGFHGAGGGFHGGGGHR